MSAYDLDLHAWAQEQASALRARSANEVDWENVAEEIESLGRQQVAELRNRLEVLLAHLLKWAYQPERRGKSWVVTIREQRRRLAQHIGENPSLRPVIGPVLDMAYQDARYSASKEMTGEPDPDTFPEQTPYSAEQVLDPDWLPEATVTSAAPPG